MSLAEGINTLRSENFSDEEILSNIRKLRPDLDVGINTLASEGFKPAEIIDNISKMQLGPVQKRKAGKAESAALGAVEGMVGAPYLIGKGAEYLFPQKTPSQGELQKQQQTVQQLEEHQPGFFENLLTSLFPSTQAEEPGFATNIFGEGAYGKQSPIKGIENFLQEAPESEDAMSRMIRVGIAGITAGLPFGLPGVIGGAVGSQAGQGVRETFGQEGKFEGWGGEAAAIAADLLAGGAAGIVTDIARQGPRVASQVPAIFERGEDLLSRATIRSTLRDDERALVNTIRNIGEEQVRGFEEAAARTSPDRYTDLVRSDAGLIKEQAENAFRDVALNHISPMNVTVEQGSRTLQETANNVFQNEVINAERTAYTAARQEAQGLEGTAPRTVQLATELRDNLTRVAPSEEQQSVVRFLNGLIDDLERTIPEETVPASSILNAQGQPITPSRVIPARTEAVKRTANELIDLIQRANAAVNYDAELRMQSHRLIPIVNALRQETEQLLLQRPRAHRLLQDANQLHARNAETWGTKFMRNLRFEENPESNIARLKRVSNMGNFKQAIQDPAMQALAERMVIQNITEKGSAQSNRQVLNQLNPQLSQNARQAGNQLSNIKDPLTEAGSRAALRNSILKEAAEAVASGKRPEQILNLMSTPKGYDQVRHALQSTPAGRRLFNAFERLFLEDVFSAALDSTGHLDFKKAQNLIKNDNVREVLRRIGGNQLVNAFSSLEDMSRNLARNIELYKKPEAVSLFKKFVEKGKNMLGAGVILHMLHVPLPIILGLGITKEMLSLGKASADRFIQYMLSSPERVALVRQFSEATNINQLGRQLPRLISEYEKFEAKSSEERT